MTMHSTNIDQFIKLNVIEVEQLQNGLVFTGKIKFRQLNDIFKLTERKENVEDPFDNSNLEIGSKENEFQRQLSEKKLKEIQSYLQEELNQRSVGKSLGMFPSSLILYNRSYDYDDVTLEDRDEDDDDEIILTEDIIAKSYKPDLDCCFYVKNQNQGGYYLYIPRNPNITLIVDGQHRFFGTKLLHKNIGDSSLRELINDFEFIVTYLVGFDIYEVGQIFAIVNFNQKPVNRSLYYDIFGSAPQTDRDGQLQNDIRLAHDLVLHLNNNELSPIKSMIKLLGKGYGLFSQAFFVEKTIRVFRTGIWNDYLIDYVNNGVSYKNIATFMRAYFSALKAAYPSSWPEKVNKNGQLVYSSFQYQYVLCKTTGLGAYFRLIKYVYPLVKDSPNIQNSILSVFQQITDDEAKDIFSKYGQFGGAGSEGMQDKLFKLLLKLYRL